MTSDAKRRPWTTCGTCAIVISAEDVVFGLFYLLLCLLEQEYSKYC